MPTQTTHTSLGGQRTRTPLCYDAVLTFILVVAVVSVCGGLVGVLCAALTVTVYVPVVVAIAMGAGVGTALGFWVHYFGLSRRSFVIAAGIFAWVSCVVVFHYTEYRAGFMRAVSQSHDVMRASDGAPALTPEQQVEASDIALDGLIGDTGFIGFLKLRARAGMRLRGFGQPKLGPWWSVSAWVADLVIMLGLTLKIGLGVARRMRL